MRIFIATLLLSAAMPALGETPAIPQPVVLDWTGAFRLNDQPTNVAAIQRVPPPAGQLRPSDRQRAEAAMGVEDHSANRTAYRRSAGSSGSLNVEAPATTGPVSVGASYGNYRAVPDTGAISARDIRLSVGVPF